MESYSVAQITHSSAAELLQVSEIENETLMIRVMITSVNILNLPRKFISEA